MATATMFDPHNWSAMEIPTMTTWSKQPRVSGASPFALLPISCCVSGLHVRGLPFSREDPPGSGS